MIKNNLSILLAERQLKITRVARDTGISRSTLTSISQNETKMIQMEVIDKLCFYLDVTPKEFFFYSPFTYKLDSLSTDDTSILFRPAYRNEVLDFIEFSNPIYSVFIEISDKELGLEEKKTFEVTIDFKEINWDFLPFGSQELFIKSINFNSDEEKKEFYKYFWYDLDIIFKKQFLKDLDNNLLNSITNDLTLKLTNENVDKPKIRSLISFFKECKIHYPDKTFFKLS